MPQSIRIVKLASIIFVSILLAGWCFVAKSLQNTNFKNMKNNRCGQAKVWSKQAIKKMRGSLKSPMQRIIFEISLYTGERIGAIVALKVSDVYDRDGKVLDAITFAGDTRKSSKHGLAKTRTCAVHPDLKEFLLMYSPNRDLYYLFPTGSHDNHISTQAVDKYWRKIFEDNGLMGYSTHSSRRWVINQLRKNGVALLTIAETMGMNINTVRHYCDNDPEDCSRAIATLTV